MGQKAKMMNILHDEFHFPHMGRVVAQLCCSDVSQHLVVDSRGRRDQSWTEGRHAVLQDLFSHQRNSGGNVISFLREINAVSS